MNYRSIRLDFPTKGLSISDAEILRMIEESFAFAAKSHASAGARLAAARLAMAAGSATVDHYDDRHGSPIFYIP
jgi:hypothetical protein